MFQYEIAKSIAGRDLIVAFAKAIRLLQMDANTTLAQLLDRAYQDGYDAGLEDG